MNWRKYAAKYELEEQKGKEKLGDNSRERDTKREYETE